MLDITITREDRQRLEVLLGSLGVNPSKLTKKKIIRRVRARMLHTGNHSLSSYLSFVESDQNEQKELRFTFFSNIMPTLSQDPEITEEDLKKLGGLLQTIGINISSLKKAHLLRRVRARMKRTVKLTFADYWNFANSSEEEQRELYLAFSINVTRFFRDKVPFEFIKKEILPKLKKNSETGKITIWSAGCADGAEPYSLAILCKEINLDTMKVNILATDFNRDLLNTAKKCVYQKEYLIETPPEVQEKYFTAISPELVKISPHLREYISFKYSNLTNMNEKIGVFDLILCRNVLIYFSEMEKLKIIKKFHEALRPQGFLILGMAEILPIRYRKDFEIYNGKYRVYMKK
ncbi:MAG: CheR family methyltransferase [Promethearchaeota archaeon]